MHDRPPNIEAEQPLGFLERLTLQLLLGAASLEPSFRQRIADYILNRQFSDGGWGGREGASDLYYTGFALRSLAVLGLLEGPVAESAHRFLQSKMQSHQGWVDLLSWVYSDKMIEAACGLSCLSTVDAAWQERFVGLLQTLRRPDGGFSKSQEGQASSTYQTFLAVICLELLRIPMPQKELAASFLLKQRQPDGGFLEIRVAKRSGANPTAAAIVALKCLDACDPMIGQSASEFLLDLQTEEGGFQANTRMPMPDVLSTFTAMSTLAELEAIDQVDASSVRRYVRSMHRDSGGFAGFELDPEHDVEYTFYALGALAFCQLLDS